MKTKLKQETDGATDCIHHYGIDGKPCPFFPEKCDKCRDYDNGLDEYNLTAGGEVRE